MPEKHPLHFAISNNHSWLHTYIYIKITNNSSKICIKITDYNHYVQWIKQTFQTLPHMATTLRNLGKRLPKWQPYYSSASDRFWYVVCIASALESYMLTLIWGGQGLKETNRHKRSHKNKSAVQWLNCAERKKSGNGPNEAIKSEHIFYLWLSQVSRVRLHICNVLSQWLSICSALARNHTKSKDTTVLLYTKWGFLTYGPFTYMV